jgi:peroxiredoxin
MSETASTMLALGTQAPTFELINVRTQKSFSLNDTQPAKATVIMFICNHCPYVIHIQKKLVEVANLYLQKGIAFVAINSNDVTKYPADNPDNMRTEAERHHYPFPYLFDETQAIAKAYHAACTPDFFVFDETLSCVYRGRFDEATPGNRIEPTGKALSNALDAILENKPVNSQQFASLGCNIKWKV